MGVLKADIEAGKKSQPKKIQLKKSTTATMQAKPTTSGPGAITSFFNKEKIEKQLGLCESVSIKQVDDAMTVLKSFQLQQHVATLQLLQIQAENVKLEKELAKRGQPEGQLQKMQQQWKL